MKILWINHRDPRHPEAGGAEVRLHEIGKRLAKMGHEVTLLCEKVNGLPAEETLDGIYVKRVGNKFTIHLIAPAYVRKHGDEYDVIIDDIAHAMPWYSPLVTKTPVIAQIHHIHQDVLHLELSKPMAWIVGKAEKTIAKVYSRFIAVSHSTKEALVKRFGLNPDKITVIYNGIDLTKYTPGSKNLSPTILWVGRIKKYKNLDHLLRAYQIVKRRIPESQLVIIGTGDQEDAMKRLAKSLKLRDVYFLGRVSEEEKIKWMRETWLIVSTSSIEGWGITILEAAACKTPAVAYNVPGLKDSVKHMETGLLVELGNIDELVRAIRHLLIDSNLRSELAENAYRYAQGFSWEKTVESFIKTIKRL